MKMINAVCYNSVVLQYNVIDCYKTIELTDTLWCLTSALVQFLPLLFVALVGQAYRLLGLFHYISSNCFGFLCRFVQIFISLLTFFQQFLGIRVVSKLLFLLFPSPFSSLFHYHPSSFSPPLFLLSPLLFLYFPSPFSLLFLPPPPVLTRR